MKGARPFLCFWQPGLLEWAVSLGAVNVRAHDQGRCEILIGAYSFKCTYIKNSTLVKV
jgi:hypothetical protein